MSFTTFLPLISALVVTALSIFVLLQNKKNRINITFFVFSVCMTGWFICTFMMFISKGNTAAIIFWDKLVYAFVDFMPVFTYQFYFAFANKKFSKLLYSTYGVAAIFLFLTRSKYFVDGVYVYSWGVHTQARLFHHLFLVFFTFCVLLWFFSTLKFYRSLKNIIQKKQTKYVFIAFAVFYLIAPLGFLSAYGIGIYPVTYFSGLIFTVIMAYAIYKYGALDITPKMIAENIIATMSDFVVVADRNMKIALINDTVAKSLNCSKESLKNKTINSVLSSEISSLPYEQAVSRAPVLNYKIDIILKNGEKIPVSANISVLKQKNSESFGIVFVMRDMRQTEELIKGLKQKTEELEAAKKELEQRNEEFEKTNEKLEQTNKLMIGRELKMAELKKENEELKNKLGGL
jgi:PAS domain S-box-containing protein